MLLLAELGVLVDEASAVVVGAIVGEAVSAGADDVLVAGLVAALTASLLP